MPFSKEKRKDYQRKKRSSMTSEEKKQEIDRLNKWKSLQSPSATLAKKRCSTTAETKQDEPNQIKRCRLEQTSKWPGRCHDKHPTQHYLGKMDIQCKFCYAYHFGKEKNRKGDFSLCCSSGSITLPPLNTYPIQFQTWLTTDTNSNFRENIRKYNNAFAFASFGCDSTVKFSKGPSAFVIHGQVYHLMSSSLEKGLSSDASNRQQCYAQLYILDPEFANSQRLNNNINSGCTQEVCQIIDSTIRKVNPYAAAFQMMREVIAREENANQSIEMWIVKDRVQDPRRYNLPTANEVAAVFVSKDGEPPFNRDIAVHSRGSSQLQQIRFYSPNCDPMTYPLLFPHGEPGWAPGMKKSAQSDNNQKNLSMLEFYLYRLQKRELFNPILHASKLTQQYIVDAFLKVEAQRLEWNRQNQKTLRVELYLGLMDYVNSQAEQMHLKPGRIVILPSSFSGGKRAMQQNYQDAMMLVTKFGKPDLFITFTCNPKWKEIKENLTKNENAIDRPDLVSRVFHLKLKEMLNDLTTKHVLGKVAAYTYVIEFQKRGLPHCHMLLILDENSKPKSDIDVDSIVCAEIPDANADEELFNIVTTCMLHGPCGENFKNAPCMEIHKGVLSCTKRFPKDFKETTEQNVDGYPLYRRRNDGRVVKLRNTEFDNRWVVPYNPFLSRKYNAHVNVEICSSVKSVKYIFKYVYKGHDAAVVRVAKNGGTLDWDEIGTYLNTRYIAAPEAMWRLNKYEMSCRSHAVERLPVHLPLQQNVYFQDGDEQRALQEANLKGTKLTKWFELNQINPNAQKYLYSEIPYNFVWRNNMWHHRKAGKIISRIYSVSLQDTERYCLKLLLMHVPGAKSYEDLRTISGVTYSTFQKAAKAMGLLDDDEEWEKAMEEASAFQMPSELRRFFVAILTHGNPTNSKELYERFKAELMEDYTLILSEYMAEQQALNDIQQQLGQFGKTCDNYKLPTPKNVCMAVDTVDIEKEREEAQRLLSMMNSEQKSAFDIIVSAIEGKSNNKCFMLSGAGGCGKTFVYRALTCKILGDGGVIKAVAPTGLAATLLKGGKTVHSGFGIPIDLNDQTTSHFRQGSLAWKELLKTKLIIWDEISMCHVHLLNAVDRSLRSLLNSNDPFGGIVIVLGGDFRQQAPVVMHSNRVDIVEACVKSSHLWKGFTNLKLSTNMRVNQDEVGFSRWLLQVGSGKDHNGVNTDFVPIDEEMLTNDVIKRVFGEDLKLLSANGLASRAILSPKNSDTLEVNEKILKLLPGDTKSYYSVDKLIECESEEERLKFPIEYINSLTPMGLPPHTLNLKKNCCVTLLRNLNPKRGLCNGTRLMVESFGENVIECSIFSGERKGERVLIPRIPLDSGNNSDLPFKLQRKQFPVRLAYSITITKSQGQTFDKIGVLLPDPVFTHGQLYTAFSRVRSKAGLSIQFTPGPSQGKLRSDDKTYCYNCVYRELLD